MRACGRFEAVSEVASQGFTTIFSARPAGDDGPARFVIKAVQRDLHIEGGDAYERDAALFMESASLQRKVQAAGGKRWARVHELSKSEEGAGAVMDFFPRSVRTMILRKEVVTDRALAAMVRAVAEGLEELKRLGGGRPHGNLRASNVLVGEGDAASAEVVLVDPLPAGKLGRIEESHDLRDLGRMIFQLVMRRELRDRDPLNAPVKPTEEWGPTGALGAAGEFWRDLCERLADPVGSGRPALSVESLLAELDKPRAAGGGGGGGRKGLVIGVAAVVLLAGAAAAVYFSGVLTPRPPPEPQPTPNGPPPVAADDLGELWRRLCDEAAWYNDFELNGLPRILALERIEDGAVFRQIRALAPENRPLLRAVKLDAESEAMQEGPLRARNMEPAEGFTAAEAAKALADLGRVKDLLRQWRPARELRERSSGLAASANLFGVEEWGQLAADLAQPVERFERLLAQTAERRDREIDDWYNEAVLDRRGLWGSLVGEIGVRWRDSAEAADLARRLDEMASRFDAHEDALVRRFRDFVASQARGLRGETISERLADLRARLDEAAEAGETITPRLVKFDPEYLNEDRGYQTLMQDTASRVPRRGDFDAWARLVDGIQPFGDDPRPGRAREHAERVAAIESDLAQAEALAQQLNERRAEVGQLRGEQSGLNAKLEALEKLPWRRATQGEVQAALADFARATEALENRSKSELARLRQVQADRTANLADFWDQKRQLRISRHEEVQRRYVAGIAELEPQAPDVGRARALAGAWESAFKAVDEAATSLGQVEAGAGLDSEALQRIFDERRARGLRDALAGVPDVDTVLNRNDQVERHVRNVRAELENWANEVRGLAASAGAVVALLDEGYDLGERSGQGQSIAEVYTAIERSDRFAEVRAAFAPLIDRVEELQRVPQLAREQLLALVRPGGARQLASALAGWRRLSEADSGWPSSLRELGDADGLGAGLVAVVNSTVRDTARRDELTREFASHRRGMWIKVYEGLGAEQLADVGRVIDRMGDFGVVEADVERLSERARYNYAVDRIIRARDGFGPATTDDEVKRAVTPWLDRIETLNGIAGNADVARLREGLAFLRGAAAAPAKPDLTKIGPASKGWAAQAAPDRSRVTYTLAVPGRAEVSLEFVMVNVGGTESYLCTTELSFAQYVALMDGRWEATFPAEFGRANPSQERRAGPALWFRTAARVPLLGRAPARLGQGWFRNTPGMQDQPYYPAALAASVRPPTEDLPMQFVSPAAAIFAAAIAGCRLPSAEEWRAALQMDPDAERDANLRDETWKTQFEHIRSIDASKNPDWPNMGIFVPAAQARTWPTRVNDAEVHPRNDGVLWFRPVAAGAGTFRNLVGNVAEFVVQRESVERLDEYAASMTPGTPVQSAVTLAGDVGLQVIGGSALSPPSFEASTPHQVAPGQRTDFGDVGIGYSDVGVRLAFSAGLAGPRPAWEQVAEVLRGADGRPPFLAAR